MKSPWLIGCWALAVLVSGCDMLLPAPSPPPPERMALSELTIIADPTLPCLDRAKEMSDFLPCSADDTVQGFEAFCPLEPPFDQLRFGCGPKPDEASHVRLRLTAPEPGVLTQRAEEAFGSCEFHLLGPLAGATPRWPNDPGELVCFLREGVGSGFRTFPKGARAFPAGLFLTYDVSHLAPAVRDQLRSRTPAELGLEPSALVIESELLGPDTSAELLQIIETILKF